MPNRPYKCPLCHSVFRTESGMEWHIVHTHDIPTAIDTLGKDYEAKTISLQNDNAQLKQKLGELDTELKSTEVKLLAETAAKLEAHAQVLQLTAERDKAIVAMAVRDHIIQEKLHMQLKNPFE